MWSWYKLLSGDESVSRAKTLGIILGIIAVLVGFVYTGLHWALGLVVFVMVGLCFTAVALLGSGRYGAAAVMLAVAGITLIPIGVLGVVGSIIAWHHTERYKASERKHQERMKEKRREIRKRRRR